ncbi:MAG: hypothetical protein O7J95_14190 [Planctomycetota bacterium]|nr:hypothetical protein [Planctomycetota bacterium]
MSGDLNIRDVIQKSTSKVSLQELSRKGVKQVKVLNQAAITRLIAEAVDEVISQRAKEITSNERRRVIEESRERFEALAKKAVRQERSRSEGLADANRVLAQELETSKKLADGSTALTEELESQVAVLRSLQEENVALKAQLGDSGDSGEKDQEIQRLREELVQQQRFLANLEGTLTAKNDEIQRLASSGEPQDVNSLKASLEGLQKSLANISRRGIGGAIGPAGEDVDTDTLLKFVDHGDDLAMESNISEVEVDKKKSKGVGSSLAKLKELQKGV